MSNNTEPNNVDADALGEDDDYEPLYLLGIKQFNDSEFFEAHDTWEELWTEYRGDDRTFYQGMIQTAVALHHFGNGNTRGARKVYNTSIGYLEKYLPFYEGIDLVAFLAQFKCCFQEVLDSDEDYPKLDLVPDLMPEIHLAAELE